MALPDTFVANGSTTIDRRGATAGWEIDGATARPEFPTIFRFRRGDGLPLQVGDRVGSAASERPFVIFPVAGARAACLPGGRAGMLALKFPCYLAGSVLPG